ncbi:hypothetical protein ABT090_20890 [Streptomyces asoensis]|uniref:hypothetical protein n=1 Tax=Streptomyces asoensis TaxID=249586 RepID=UPI00331BD6E5
MTTYTSRTITTTRREWIIPAPQPWGACIGDINTAFVIACRTYRETHGLAANASIPDNGLRFHIRDDEIVIAFETEVPEERP